MRDDDSPPHANGSGATDAGEDAARPPRPRRSLNSADRLIRVPLGFLWLGVIVIAAMPVMIYMTSLYWIARLTSALFRRNRAPRARRDDREERVA